MPLPEQPQASPTPPEHGRSGTGVRRSATLPGRCGNSNRAFWPPFSARWTRRPVEPPPAREQQNRLPASYAQKASLRQLGRSCWKRMPPPPPGERPGWQRTASKALHKPVLETLFTELDPTSRALLLSQGGDAASCAFTAFPTSADTRVPDDEFRVMLLRRLRLPLPLAPKRCACRGLLDVYGDHRSACAQVGVLVANGLPLWQGAQVAVDATVVSPVRRDGQPRPRADQQPGLALAQAVDRKDRTYPELRQARRCRLVVFGVVRSEDALAGPRSPFLRLLAKARARQNQYPLVGGGGGG